ncbi:NAD(P)-binding protein [Cuspidothrix issatschenkoi]|uniref:Amine oxidase domain-containing protein n=1 Tax=Cuspidothrix issatschenkoi CHARLIE-1 TaxID=2052836 RepID=A0A2S6CTD4_9CYAN|nr:NAD(P)-binding protein [Cuspidothrix issatschenkoi]PPJ63038.1 hypothetical protein CUN59_12470 [Cuspidothrix issatschenkoi CHARLIE-1]
MKNTIIVGSGISGLLSAYILSNKKNPNHIILIDKSKEPGGLLRAFDYGNNGKFDYGMHNMLETSIPELDRILYGFLPDREWQILEGSKRDIAGIYYNGQLQHETPYFDLRNLDENTYKICIAELFIHLNKKLKGEVIENKNGTACEYAYSRFGKVVADHTIIPAIEKIYRKSANDLDYMATIFTPMTRVALFDEPLTRDMTTSPILKDHIAFVDQRNLPLERSSNRRGFYPVKYGMYRIVEAIVQELCRKGVQILTQAEIAKIEANQGIISSVYIRQQNQEHHIDDIDQLIWTANIPFLGKLLGVDLSQFTSDPSLKTVVISLLLNKQLEMGDLYYFFCYDQAFNTYRLTNFSNYCHGAYRNGGYPISMELLVSDEDVKSSISLEKEAEKELFRFQVTAPDTQVIFSKAEVLEGGFPMPSMNNISSLRKITSDIKNMNLKNLILTGIMAEDNLFFQTDILIDVYNKLK